MAEKVERRLAAILSADVVGYSRLIAADEEGTLARLRDVRENFLEPTIAEHRGRIFKLVGDGILVEFASVVDAVRCASAIQRGIAERAADHLGDERIVFRIGINLGDIVVDGDDIHGDGVNIAARLEGLADPGGIIISGTTFDQVRDRLDLGFTDIGEQTVKNIPRPVRAYRVLLDRAAEEEAKAAPGQRKRARRMLAGAASAVAVLGAVVGVLLVLEPWLPQVDPADPAKIAYAVPDKPSIAILPFDNVTGDPKQDYLGDGLTENIISVLSKSPDLFVIARDSSFAFKGQAAAANHVAEQLGVRYVLGGSVQRDGDQLRITAQLVDAIDGRHIWSERFDRELGIKDLFDVQDDITKQILVEMDVNLKFGEDARRTAEAFEDLETYAYFMDAARLANSINPGDILTAEEMLAGFLIDHPDHAEANLRMAWIHWQKVTWGFADDPVQSMAAARDYAEQALNEPWPDAVHVLLANIDLVEGNHASAIDHAAKALEFEPSPSVVALAGWVYVASGEAAEGVRLLRDAIRKQPLNSEWMHTSLAGGLLLLEEYEEAEAANQRLLRAFPEQAVPHVIALENLAAIAKFTGDTETARGYVDRILELFPNESIEAISARVGYLQPREFYDRYLAALREVGLPEHPPLPIPDKPSIAVLPFNNLSGDPKEDYFVDGMTETLITDLSRIPELFVIARNTSFTYKGRAVDVKNVGRELGVRYVVEGSVQRAGGRVRINAQLIDTQTGGHIWSDRFDRPYKDLFALQDQAVAKIVSALPIVSTQSKPTGDGQASAETLKAYDIYLQGLQTLYTLTKQDLERSIALFERALEIDPSLVVALNGRAWAKTQMVLWGWEQSMEFGWAAVNTAVSGIGDAQLINMERMRSLRDPAYALPLAMAARLGLAPISNPHAFENALATGARAVALAPGNADVLVSYAMVLSVAGEQERALAVLNDAYRLNPKPPPSYSLNKAWILFRSGRYDEAIEQATLFQRDAPHSHFASYVLAPALAYLGRINEAQAHIGILRVHEPDLTVYPTLIGNTMMPKLRRDRGRIVEGLRIAGAPLLPGGLEPRDERLSREQMVALLTERTITGRDFYTHVQWWVRQAADGTAQRWDAEGNEAEGRFTVEGNWACWEWNVEDDYKRCNLVYRDDRGSSERLDEYLLAGTGCGYASPDVFPWQEHVVPLCPFSVDTSDAALPLPDKPSIAVLPFDNLSDDPDQGWFADGMTDDLITDLSKISGLFVIARNTAFTYKGKAVDIKQVGRELGVRHVLEGSVRRSGGTIRINAQLIDAETGGHVWAEKYDGDAEDHFALQDEVIGKIVASLAVQMTSEEEVNIERLPTTNMKAYEHYRRGIDALDTGSWTPDGMDRALAEFEKALSLDPAFVEAYVGDASAAFNVWSTWKGWVLPAKAARERSEISAKKALELSSGHPEAKELLSIFMSADGKWDEAVQMMRAAVAQFPNNADAYRGLAWASLRAGFEDEALQAMRKHLRLEPNPTPLNRADMGLFYLHLRDYEASARMFESSLEAQPDDSGVLMNLAATYAQLGQLDKAKSAKDRSLALAAGLNVQIWAQVYVTQLRNLKVRNDYAEALRKADVPEWPFGIAKSEEDRLSDDELRAIFSENVEMVGEWDWGGGFESFSETLDTGRRYRLVSPRVSDYGTTEVRNGMICYTSEVWFQVRPFCQYVYRNPDGSNEKRNAYIQVGGTAVRHFSVTEAAPTE